MGIFESIILGIVQGLTEFLPVSSSGHLVMFQKFFGTQDELFFTLALHLGTLIAVLVVYWKDVVHIIKNPFSDLTKKLVFATIPTVVIVFILKSLVESSFSSYFFICGFLLSALLLFVTEKKYDKSIPKKSISYKNSFLIGVAQGLACFPGVSRSGSTICAGMLAGENKEEVAKFSFLLSIPIIIASCGYELICNPIVLTNNWIPIVVGMIVSMISGIFAIKLMLNVVKKVKFTYFATYLFVLSIIVTIVLNFCA